jgi:toxin YoeB
MKNLVFDPRAFSDLEFWISNDKRKALKIVKLINEIQKNPYYGIGKPEKLKNELSGCYSRRIDSEHRIVYEITEDNITILACRTHYK